MITAAWIAEALGVREVVINYRASEILPYSMYVENPMEMLQFV